jgi:hypothetical protein
MKPLICLFFLLIAGAASVYGQSLPPASPAFPPATHLLPIPQLSTLLPQHSIRILQPDNMPCLVSSLARVERMPVRRMTNADRMPNGFGKKKPE